MAETLPYTEQDFYIAAINFSDAANSLAKVTDPAQLADAVKVLRDGYNDDCLFRGVDIKAFSIRHLVDWSNGETDQQVKDLPVEAGDFEGRFIGYADLPKDRPSTAGRALTELAVVMQTDLWIPDFQHDVTVLMVTPIVGSAIRFT